MIDALFQFRAKAAESNVLERLGLKENSYAVATLHRPANVDDPGRLGALVGALARVAKRLPVIFPIHPRTQKKMTDMGLQSGSVQTCPPLGYIDFMRLMSGSRMVLTDSGGIQEETTILGVPCLTLRENTERPVTIEQGTNRLIGLDPERIHGAAMEILDSGFRGRGRVPENWDGKASGRILDILESRL